MRTCGARRLRRLRADASRSGATGGRSRCLSAQVSVRASADAEHRAHQFFFYRAHALASVREARRAVCARAASCAAHASSPSTDSSHKCGRADPPPRLLLSQSHTHAHSGAAHRSKGTATASTASHDHPAPPASARVPSTHAAPPRRHVAWAARHATHASPGMRRIPPRPHRAPPPRFAKTSHGPARKRPIFNVRARAPRRLHAVPSPSSTPWN